MWIDRALIPDPRAFLTTALGPLARCELVTPPEEVAAPAAPAVDHSRSDPALYFPRKALIPADAWVPDIMVRMKLRAVPKPATVCVWMPRKVPAESYA